MTTEQLIGITKKTRGFDARYVLKQKIKKINEFFRLNKLDCAVVGLSGGVDSSLVLKLLLKASKQQKSPIKKIVGLFLPIYATGITGQDSADIYIKALLMTCHKYPAFTYIVNDLTKVSQAYYNSMGANDPWVCGQISSIVRTPALYGCAAQQQKLGFKSIVVGTTNRDEGSYIGFFGKASDGMVDLQPIADLHKSEVNILSKLVTVPHAIINKPPEGGVWDAKIDEEMIGAPYWFLELYQLLLESKSTYLISRLIDCPDAVKWSLNIEALHQINRHKYEVGSPAHYIDVMPRIITPNSITEFKTKHFTLLS